MYILWVLDSTGIKNIISLIIGNSSWLIGKDNSSLLTLLLKPKSVIFGCMVNGISLLFSLVDSLILLLIFKS